MSDHDAKRDNFKSAIMPAVIWVDLKEGAKPKTDIDDSQILGGEVSAEFKEAKPLQWLKP